jgi:hypothetical protein
VKPNLYNTCPECGQWHFATNGPILCPHFTEGTMYCLQCEGDVILCCYPCMVASITTRLRASRYLGPLRGVRCAQMEIVLLEVA